MFYCNDCNGFFDEPEQGWEDLGVGHRRISVCPCCKGEDIEEANTCPLCGEPTLKEYCEECERDIKHDIESFLADKSIEYKNAIFNVLERDYL